MSAGTTRLRIGHGFDAHRLMAGRPCIIGGVNIPAAFGAVGHSDADVLSHAISDALLGAANLGSLGEIFPSSESQWKGADSLALLAECARRVAAAGFAIENIDATVVVEAPRITPHIPAMRQHVARTLGLDENLISIKAKTSDGLGYTGDGSGIVAYANTLLRTEIA